MNLIRLAQAIHPRRVGWKRLLHRALQDAQGDARLASILFSKWVEVRYFNNPSAAIKAISWVTSQVNPQPQKILPPTRQKGWNAFRPGPIETPSEVESDAKM